MTNQFLIPHKHIPYYFTFVFSIITTCNLFAQPELSFDTTYIDLGNLPVNSPYTTNIKVYNTGDSTLIIRVALANVGSDVAEWPTKPIPPNKKGVILFHLHTGIYPGKYHRSITVVSNAGYSTIKIHFNVKEEPIAIGDYSLNLTKIDKNSIKLILNGVYLATGDCHETPPVLNIERKVNNKWTEFYTYRHGRVDCGKPTLSCKDYTLTFNITSVTIPYENIALPPGTYRFWATTDEYKVIYSNAITIY